MELTLLLAAALGLLAAVAAEPETNQDAVLLFQNCSSDTYVPGSNLGRNVKLVVESLARNAPSTGFNTCSSSHGDRIYGLLQCRGDLPPSECARCASLISTQVLKSCGNSTSALIQLQGCFLRYGTDNFFSGEGAEGLKLMCRAGNGSHGPSKGFTETVQKLLYEVSIKAADNRGFCAQSVGSPGPNIYGVAQCWGGLSRTACGSCLTFASSCVLRCHNSPPAAQYLTTNCFVRFDTATFYYSNYSSDPRAERKGRRRGLILIILGAIICTAMAVLCRILCKWGRKSDILKTQKYSGVLVK